MAATAHIDAKKIRLFGGLTEAKPVPGQTLRISNNGLALTHPAHHNVPQQRFPLGTVQRLKDPVVGPVSFIYLRVGTQDTTTLIGPRSLCALEIDNGLLTGRVSNDATRVILGGPVVSALSLMANNNFGFFQLDGPPATGLLAELAGNYATDGNVVAGVMSSVADDGVVAFGVMAATKFPVGVSADADA